MGIKRFLKLVEIQTKVASVIPFLLGTAFVLYKFNSFNIINSILLFLSMLIFDMTTTAINNYMDYIRAIKKDGFGYEEHNALGKYNLNTKSVKLIIISMLILATTLGLLLFINTDIIVLLIGIICFIIGILYSYGPIPISRTPFGEIFSGITMGFFITFLSIYVHIYDTNVIELILSKSNLSVSVNLNIIISIIILTIPTIIGISNIMLANNICDMEEDIINKRYTLPIFIGKKNALNVFKYSYYIGFLSIIVGVLLHVLPFTSLLTLLAYKVVNENIKIFFNVQSKRTTFILSVKNFVLLNSIYVITVFLGIIIF